MNLHQGSGVASRALFERVDDSRPAATVLFVEWQASSGRSRLTHMSRFSTREQFLGYSPRRAPSVSGQVAVGRESPTSHASRSAETISDITGGVELITTETSGGSKP